MVLAACGGGRDPEGVANLGSSVTTTTAAGPAGTMAPLEQYDASLKYSGCIRSHGVPKFPDPQYAGGFPAGSLSGIKQGSPQFLRAQKACASFARAAGMGPPSEAAQQAHMVKMLKISHCMQKHGFPDFPDPDAQGGLMVNPSSLNMGSPQYEAAARKCDAPPGPPTGARQPR